MFCPTWQVPRSSMGWRNIWDASGGELQLTEWEAAEACRPASLGWDQGYTWLLDRHIVCARMVWPGTCSQPGAGLPFEDHCRWQQHGQNCDDTLAGEQARYYLWELMAYVTACDMSYYKTKQMRSVKMLALGFLLSYPRHSYAWGSNCPDVVSVGACNANIVCGVLKSELQGLVNARGKLRSTVSTCIICCDWWFLPLT